MPENPDNDPDITLASNFLKNVVIPDKEDVGIVPYKDFYGTHYFWTGDENSAMMAQSPSIQISAADEFEKMWSEANTIITIYYK